MRGRGLDFNFFSLEYAEYEKKLSDLRERAQGAAASPSPFKPSNKKELFVR